MVPAILRFRSSRASLLGCKLELPEEPEAPIRQLRWSLLPDGVHREGCLFLQTPVLCFSSRRAPPLLLGHLSEWPQDHPVEAKSGKCGARR
jgi:hypothetical protein